MMLKCLEAVVKRVDAHHSQLPNRLLSKLRPLSDFIVESLAAMRTYPQYAALLASDSSQTRTKFGFRKQSNEEIRLQRKFGLLCCLVLLSSYLVMNLFPSSAFCQAHAKSTLNLSPLEIAKHSADQLMAALRQQQSVAAHHRKPVEQLMRDILLPQMDVTEMAQRTLNPRVWQAASKGQRDAFLDAFTTVLLKTYASTLAAYTHERMIFLPLVPGWEQLQRIQVSSRLYSKDGSILSIHYYLVLKDQHWRLYDFNVEGMSMLQSFHEQFREILAQQGIQGVIDQLKKHNAQ